MKTVYFVRHGESEGNVSDVVMGYKGGLTKKGFAQADEAAHRCSTLPIEVIISSPLQRTRQTAEIIAEVNTVTVEYSELFVERRNPSTILGCPKSDAESLAIRRDIWANFREGWRHSDEENFDDLKVRAKKALAYLTQRPENHILVCGHGIFSRILLAHMVFGDALTGVECAAFTSKFETWNTGIGVFYFDDAKQIWEVFTWNDNSHLGETTVEDLAQ